MLPIFTYLIKSSITLALLYCLFRFVMRNDSGHALNRFVLLGILLVSAVLPLMNVQFFYEEIPIQAVETFREYVAAPVFTSPEVVEIAQPFVEDKHMAINWWLVIYLSAASLLLLRMALGVVQVIRMISKAEEHRMQEIILAVVKELIQPFSFFNKVVLSERDYTQNRQIVVAHEHAHIKQKHAFDLLVCELFTVLQFFNPFMWLLRRDLKLIHEYQADQAVLNKGIDAQKYQLLVLEKAVGERRFAMANHFTQKPILKRLKMMKKTNKDRWGRVKLILFVPIIIVLLQAFARPETLVEKVSDIVPLLTQQDSTEVWIENWVKTNMALLENPALKNTAKYKDQKGVHVMHIVDSDARLSDLDKDTHKKNNVFIVLQNRKGELLIEGKHRDISELKKYTKQFVKGENSLTGENPDHVKKNVPSLGEVSLSEGIILYRKDLTTPKTSVESVLKIFAESIMEVRQECAKKYFAKDYFELSGEQKEAVDQVVPAWISYAEPRGKKVSSKAKDKVQKLDHSVFKYNNVLEIRIDENNNYRIGTRLMKMDGSIAGIVSRFLEGKHPFDGEGPDFETKHFDGKGDLKVCKGQVVIRSQENTPEILINHLKKKVDKGYADARDKKAKELWGNQYLSLSAEKKNIINEIVPKRISLTVNKEKFTVTRQYRDVKPAQIENKQEGEGSTNGKGSGVPGDVLVPDGFSPNGDGIHDRFIIKGIYPQYPNAKLLVFDKKGNKLFEQEKYGNLQVWNNKEAWWDGTSDIEAIIESDGILPPGYYNYVLKLGNGKDLKGTLMLAKSAPPKVL